ncbi:MAG: hypothetical protein R3C15_04635 [Thermoleophilia bacterium]
MPGAQTDDPADCLLDPDDSAAFAASRLGEQAVAAFLAATRATPRAPLESRRSRRRSSSTEEA